MRERLGDQARRFDARGTKNGGAPFGAAAHIERVDCLVRRIARQQGLPSDTLDEIVTLVDERLNRPFSCHNHLLNNELHDTTAFYTKSPMVPVYFFINKLYP